MIHSDYQTICFHQNYTHAENPAVATGLIAFATVLLSGVEAVWNVLTIGLHLKAENTLFPAWYK